MGIIDDYGMILLILAVLFGIFMAWGVGANDVANAMGTSVGAKAITIKQAIVIAMVLNLREPISRGAKSPPPFAKASLTLKR